MAVATVAMVIPGATISPLTVIPLLATGPFIMLRLPCWCLDSDSVDCGNWAFLPSEQGRTPVELVDPNPKCLENDRLLLGQGSFKRAGTSRALGKKLFGGYDLVTLHLIESRELLR